MILERTIGKAGTVAVGQFTPDGKLVAYKSNEAFSAELAMMTSQFAATTRMFLSTVAASFSHLTELPLVPYHGLIFSGGDMSSVIRQDHWAIVRTSESEFMPSKGAAEPGLEDLLRAARRPLRRLLHRRRRRDRLQADDRLPPGRCVPRRPSSSPRRRSAFHGLATAFSHLSKSSWTPVKAWLYAGR